MRLNSEIWCGIGIIDGVDLSDKYEISSKGRFRILDRYVCNNGGKQFYEGRILNGYDNKCGYLARVLKVNKKRVTIKFHKLVAEKFLINPNGYKYVNHKDENKKNNDVNNLEWCTFQYNLCYGTRLERIIKSNSKPVVQLDMEGNFIKEWSSASEAGRNGFTYQNIRECVKGKHRQHKGYKWVSLEDYNKQELG